MTKRALKANKVYDVIIVPGIPFYEPTWDRVMQMRVIWAKHLYDRGIAKNIITSGGAVYSPYIEAEIMKEYLIAMGVPRENIFTEERAEHSTENVWYGYKLAQKKGFKSVAVCSDPFQSKMLYRFAKRKTKKQVKFLPAIFDTLRGLPHDTPVVNYAPLKIENFISITQRQSKWKRFMGTIGRHIDFKETD
ncbi:YdcF family protein [Aurantibacillus circumpalustris]|uniref:YdcF family protein n=1 Tax=Aurantibacillus circumpalustris TaxID=3036359 RepID=UPI00295B1435|nr:YdcF family protein [Aurantibacillus circumpalustris]